jgi:ribosomal protein S18 acetylase RimI-like enzyme
MRKAFSSDTPLLVELMSEFYAEAGYMLNRSHATQAFEALLAEERLGNIWLIQAPGTSTPVGYLVLTLCYSMEYGGMKAFVEDLFVRLSYRNLGLGSGALATIREFCQQVGIRAVSVEVGPNNGPAQAVYRRTGFLEVADRQWLTLPLASATHES